MPELSEKISQARGDSRADLVLRGARIFDTVTGHFLPGDLAICGDTIVGIGADYDAIRIIDVTGKTLVPGFIDTHLHIESSLVTPYEFDRCVAPFGVTTAICDPHEIANVIGIEGIKYFLDAAQDTLMDIRVQLSSCVPATHMETSGAVLSAQDLAPYMDHPKTLGLAEMMNYPGVIHRDPTVIEKLELFKGRHIDGHCPQLSGRDLNAYISAGIRTEHEATTANEAREKLQKGLRVLIREGSVSKDMDALLSLLTVATSPYMCLCTDDRNPLDIFEQGHLDFIIRTALARGVDPLAIYRAASLSAAEAFGLRDRGQIAPSKRADIVVLDDFDTCAIDRVFCGGVEATADAFAQRSIRPVVGLNSVHCPDVHADWFRTASNTPHTDVIGIIEGKIITEHLIAQITPVDGDKAPDPARDLAKIAVIERHGKSGRRAVGFVKGFGMTSGAIAATVCHDHHNIVVTGVDHADMAYAVRRLGELQGGFVVVQDGHVLAEIALPIAGLMSDLPFETVRAQLITLRESAKALGVVLHEPFLQLAFLALPVIPSLKITDHGMVDVTKFEIISAAQ